MVGNLPNFSKIDVLRCLFAIEKPVSRSYLSKELELGEGTIRSILDILKEKEYIASTNAGHSLSEKGKSAVNNIKKSLALKRLGKISFFPNKKSAAIQLKNVKKEIKPIILRDEAVKNGAEGALILKYSNKLRFYELDHKEDLSEIEKSMDLDANDIVIISYSNSHKSAENGALSAAILVDNNIKRFLDGI